MTNQERSERAQRLLDEGELEILPAHLPEELFMSDPAEDETAPRPAPQDAPPPGALPAAARVDRRAFRHSDTLP